MAIRSGATTSARSREKGDSHQSWVTLTANEAWPRLEGAPGAEDPVTGRTRRKRLTAGGIHEGAVRGGVLRGHRLPEVAAGF